MGEVPARSIQGYSCGGVPMGYYFPAMSGTDPFVGGHRLYGPVEAVGTGAAGNPQPDLDTSVAPP